MNGSIVEAATFMVSFGWKMHHLWMHLTEIMQSLYRPFCISGINMSQLGIQIKIVLQQVYILLLKCSTLCRMQKKELAEMLNHLQRHTKCAPGYCEQNK